MASPPLSMLDSNSHVDKLTSDIFSILENNFLFGTTHIDNNNNSTTLFGTHIDNNNENNNRSRSRSRNGKVRILSLDGGQDPILAAAALCRLESALRRHHPDASLPDFFDLAAGSGSGGLLAALLFTRRPDSSSLPLFSAASALDFLSLNRHRLFPPSSLFRRTGPSSKFLREVFGEATLRDTCRAVIVPCYDLTTGAPFVFSRADAVETDGCDFRMRDVCGATMARERKRVGGVTSVDGRTRISAVGGEVAMNNPTAAAITHVLNNKNEFPLCNGVEDLLVVSLGNGESGLGMGGVTSSSANRVFVRIAGEGASDLVDQAVSMAFGDSRANNYVRIQTNGPTGKINKGDILGVAEEMLAQKNIESVLFQGKRLAKSTNLEKLEMFALELVKEQERRKTSILPTVVLKHGSPSPRTSSATTLSSLSSN